MIGAALTASMAVGCIVALAMLALDITAVETAARLRDWLRSIFPPANKGDPHG